MDQGVLPDLAGAYALARAAAARPGPAPVPRLPANARLLQPHRVAQPHLLGAGLCLPDQRAYPYPGAVSWPDSLSRHRFDADRQPAHDAVDDGRMHGPRPVRGGAHHARDNPLLGVDERGCVQGPVSAAAAQPTALLGADPARTGHRARRNRPAGADVTERPRPAARSRDPEPGNTTSLTGDPHGACRFSPKPRTLQECLAVASPAVVLPALGRRQAYCRRPWRRPTWPG